MTSKINIGRIFVDHFLTLKNDETNKTSILDIVFFFVIPIAPTAILLWREYLVNKDGLGLVFSTYSIFIGLLFNLLALLYSIFQNPQNQTPFKKSLLRELLANISFEIVISIISMMFSLLAIIARFHFDYIFSGLTYYTSGICLFTLFMVLKRVYLFIYNDLKN